MFDDLPVADGNHTMRIPGESFVVGDVDDRGAVPIQGYKEFHDVGGGG